MNINSTSNNTSKSHSNDSDSNSYKGVPVRPDDETHGIRALQEVAVLLQGLFQRLGFRRSLLLRIQGVGVRVHGVGADSCSGFMRV